MWATISIAWSRLAAITLSVALESRGVFRGRRLPLEGSLVSSIARESRAHVSRTGLDFVTNQRQKEGSNQREKKKKKKKEFQTLQTVLRRHSERRPESFLTGRRNCV